MADLIYRVHRYIYTSQQYAKEEYEEISEELNQILEWYTLYIKLVFKSEGALTVLFNKFLSKKDKNTHEIIDHVSGIKLLKSDTILKVSKDQLLLLTFLKNIIEDTIKDFELF